MEKQKQNLILILIFSLLCSNGNTFSLSRDYEILLHVKNTQINDQNKSLKDWLPNTYHYPCNWTGITCDSRNKSVTSIDLSEIGIYGDFPFNFCRIPSLQNLSLAVNFLGNSISSHSILPCSHLHLLNISDNLFVGNLPEFNSETFQLRVLDLSLNNFTGNIPASFGRFPRLKTLILSSNLFTGTIPSFLGNLTELTHFELTYTETMKPGSIPSELGNLTKLQFLYLSDINLVGNIPDSVGNLISIENFDLSRNSLSGKIPYAISGMKNVKRIILFENNLSGEIPQGLSNLTSLSLLDLSQNALTGKFSQELGSLNLSILHLNDNFLSGEVPESLALNPNLLNLSLFNNSFSGKLSKGLGKNSALRNIDVSTNNFTGDLPEFLCVRKKLQRLVTFNNRFSGSIPDEFGECDSLIYVRIENNEFSGSVPARFWNLPELDVVKMDHNKFEGSISGSVSRGITKLILSGNRFSGEFPVGVCELVELVEFDIGNNLFTGEVPSCITGMKKLQKLEMQENTFSGEIPGNVSSWTELTELNLSHNRFTGSIPPELGNLPDLTYLDLSVNFLTGKIPVELTNLKLNQFNVSDNKLSGEVPSVFNSRVYLSGLMANPSLCSNVMKTISPCSKHKPFSVVVIIVLVASVVLIFASVLWFLKRKSKFTVGKSKRAYRTISFQRVGFNEEDIIPFLTSENLIGRGGSGLVYKVKVKTGQVVAVKKLWGGNGRQKPEMELVFKSEIETLGRIRHANILKLLFCCSSDDFRILVYEYMENGSLGDVLHEEKCDELLDWSKRFRIALGAAQGLAYLHHDCVPAIVHRDVKSNNILLDHDFVPRIADFGIAKTLQIQGSENAMSRIAGSCGYIAPEYGYTLKVTEKSDVYSFGVVLMELITGKRPNDSCFGENKDIVKWVTEISLSTSHEGVQDCGVTQIVDSRLNLDTSDYEEVEKVLNVALLCTSAFPISRPSMRRVVEFLKDHKVAHPKS
ncbi:hypothetical protein RYX36_003441 [Vicia faba]